ncbi:MAG: ribokinase [Alphaproteobacteria bacterium]|nr:ribokinase [Alphaproteobacteria bacterium]
MSAPDILVVGSANMDLVAFADRLPAPGETLLGGAFQSFAGGKGGNQAVAAARAGGKVAFLGCVGNDLFGARLRGGLEEDGVDTRLLGTVDGASGVAIIMSGGGNNMIVVAPGANDAVTADIIDRRAFAGIRFVLAQLETPLDGVIAAARLARAEGATFILDPAPARALPGELLSLVDWLTPNESEACGLLGVKNLSEPVAAARQLKALGPRGVVLKLGGEGVVVLGGDDVPLTIPARKVTVADTTAAGDAFNGAFAVALSEGKTAQEAARFAVAAAGISVTRQGAQPAMAKRAEIDAVMARG